MPPSSSQSDVRSRRRGVRRTQPLASGLRIVLVILAVCVSAGCARTNPYGPALPVPPRVSTNPVPVPPPDAAVPISIPVPVLVPDEDIIPPPPPSLNDVAILFSGSNEDYATVAAEVARLLPSKRFRVTRADIEDADWHSHRDRLRLQSDMLLIAIGLPAAREARDAFDAPVVFAQVFNYTELMVDGRPIHGVASLPPFDLLLRAWKNLDPELNRVGLIAGTSDTSLLHEAETAASARAVHIQSAVSSSDQETLYLFRRLAADIDGFWLIPDERILSPTALRELLEYAVSHDVGVTVPNSALLGWGALLSASSTKANIAETVYRVVDRMVTGSQDSVPGMTPLSEAEIRINGDVAERLGLVVPGRTTWIVRE